MKDKSGASSEPIAAAMTIVPAPPEARESEESRLTRLTSGGTPSRSDTTTEGLSYRDLLEAMVDGLIVCDTAGSIIDVNQTACDLLAMDRERIFRLKINDVISGADIDLINQVSNRLWKTSCVVIDASLVTIEGNTVPAHFHATRLTNGNDPRFSFFFRQIVAEEPGNSKKAGPEEANAGTIAGQIAHDFDNLLTPLFSYPELIRRELPEESRAQHLLDVMEKTAQDMKNITQQLLSLSKRGKQSRVLFDMNGVVERVLALFADSIATNNIEVFTVLAPDLFSMEGVPGQMLRVIQNLYKNAIDAVGSGGQINVVTENIYLDRPIHRGVELEIGEYVRVRISDNGPGIPFEMREKVFDPFFSTKQNVNDTGSGLGLSVVRGIVKDHSGAIELKTALGKGTTFDLYFRALRPIDKEGAVEDEEVSGKTIMIVDDDPAQREIIASMFEQRGCRTLSQASGENAVEYLIGCSGGHVPSRTGEESDDFPDLIVVDAIMDPGMDGKETCNRILELNPEQRIIVVSGLPTPEDVGVGRLLGTVSYLRKPLLWSSFEAVMSDMNRHRGEAESDELHASDRARLLIVDDEEGICRLFDMILSAAFPKVTIDITNNGADGIDEFSEHHHSVVIMDLMMPVLDGNAAYQRIESICAEKEWVMPSIVFCTGFAPPTGIRDIIKANRNHCLLTKPISADVLVDVVSKRIAALPE
jgi:PAS domain S-box-containing protein